MSNRPSHRPPRPHHYEQQSSTSPSNDGPSSASTDKDVASSNAAAEAIKHRRSRSGCYTCRNRRVKCDEARPVCDRCRKGGRDCIYPEPPRPSKSGSRSKIIPEAAVPTTEDSELKDENSPASQEGAPRIFDRSPSTASASLSPPAVVDSPQSTSSEATKARSGSRRLRSDLPPEFRFYLDYQRGHMSFYHYGLTLDCRSFVHNFLITQALSNDALLHAVCAFAAYHHAIRTEESSIQEFLPHYGKSLTCLRESLGKGNKPTIADLLTVLQLAVLEEHLGDWVTLVKHQKAAYSILTTLFTPQTMLHDDVANKILEWYIRFDLFVGFIAGSGATLGKEWFEAQYRYYVRQVKEYPTDIGYKWDERNACERLLAKDVALMFAKKSKGLIDNAEFNIETSDMSRRFNAWYRDLPPAIMDPSKVVKDLRHDNSVVWLEGTDASAEAVVYGDDLWPTNHMFVHFWGVELMFNHQLATLQQRPTPPDVAGLALKICQMFEAIEKYDPQPGALLGVHAATSMASVFLSRKPQLTMWFRRKQVLVESAGYVYPTQFRHRMSGAWGVDVGQWWLPDGEGQTPIMKQIRDFVDYRNSEPKDHISRDLKEMSGIFETLKFNDE